MRTTGSTPVRALARAIGIITTTGLVFFGLAVPAALADTVFTVTGTAGPITYGDAPPTYGFTMGGAVLEAGDSWQTEPVCSSSYVQGAAAGPYTTSCTSGVIVDSGQNDVTGNYTITYAEGTLTVNAYPVTVTATAKTLTYGDAVPASYASTSGSLLAGHSWDPAPTCVGSYTVTTAKATYDDAITCSGGTILNASDVDVTSNYAITYVPGDIVVNGFSISVTAADLTVTYGDDEPSFTPTLGTPVAGDSWGTNPTCNSAYSPGSPVGRYAITCTGGALVDGSSNNVTANYTITYVPGTLTVDPYEITTAEVEYTGQTEYRTKSSSDTAVQVTLTASVSLDTDTGTAGVQCPSDTDLDIQDARLTFIDADTGKVFARDVHVGAVPETECEGIATAVTTLSTGSAGVEDYTFLVLLGGSFTGSDNSGQAIGKTVTVFQLIPAGIAGGLGSGTLDYLSVNTSTDKGTTGAYADGEDASFIFRFVASTKKTKPSGGATLTVPQSDGSYYEVKTNAITSVSVSTVGSDRKMVVYAKANVTWFDGLGGSTAVDSTGGTSVQITIIDAASGAANDTAAFTVTAPKTGALLFSNHWTKTGKAWSTYLDTLISSTVALS